MMSLALPQNARVVHSAYYDDDQDFIIANISNQSTVQVVIPAQTVRVIGVQLGDFGGVAHRGGTDFNSCQFGHGEGKFRDR